MMNLVAIKKLSSIDHGFVTTILAMICMIVCILFNTRYSIVDNLIETILATFSFVLMMVLNYSAAASSVFNKNKLGVLKKVLSIAFILILAYFIYRQCNSILSVVSFEFMMVGIVVVSLPILLSSKFNVVSDYFKNVAPELLGFKDFVEKAEVPQLERLSMENPSYYYDVIPYAMVLDYLKCGQRNLVRFLWHNQIGMIRIIQIHTLLISITEC